VQSEVARADQVKQFYPGTAVTGRCGNNKFAVAFPQLPQGGLSYRLTPTLLIPNQQFPLPLGRQARSVELTTDRTIDPTIAVSHTRTSFFSLT
jgi:hypothetical protein